MDHKKEYPVNYIANILSSVKTIAMIGASPDPTKFSYGVLRVLHEQGYKMFPINARKEVTTIRGLKVYSSLNEIRETIDMVQVFRKPEALTGIAQEAIDIGAKVLWGQIGVFNEGAALLAESNGIKVVMNRCPKIEGSRPCWKPKLN